MHRLEITLPTPEENLALDEALLDWAEADGPDCEFLRVWESPQPMIVVGRSSRVHQEVNTTACLASGIPILRRSSGGAAIVAGPGCLMYALVLSYARRPELKDIRRAHCIVLTRLAQAIGPLVQRAGLVHQAGTSDLVIADREFQAPGGKQLRPQTAVCRPETAIARKFAGNSLRAKRTHLLYHGTLLYDFDLSLIEACLPVPPRVPDYRKQRSHLEFVTNLPVSRSALIEAIDRAWPAAGELRDWPTERVAQLVAERFRRASWNFEFE